MIRFYRVVRHILPCILPLLLVALGALNVLAQGSSAGTLYGTVTDPSGAVISGAAVRLFNKASGFTRGTTTDAAGQFSFSNVPFSPYQIEVTSKGFSSLMQSTMVHSVVATNLNVVLQIAGASQTVTVESNGPMVENTSTFHTDVDRDLFNKIPLESTTSSLSSLVTQTTPGVSADSNGLFHGMGDHASNSFSVDGQPITDQQSKVFSNQLPTNAVQSIQVIEGAPPAQYGDKTSLVIVATTRSGQGVTRPTGSVYSSYGTFGSATAGANLSYGKQNWGNFVEVDGLNTGRFLDPPEFTVMHAKGNEENVFDRFDFDLTPADSIHLNLNYTRSWFQNPNAFDNLNVQNVLSGGTSANPTFGSVGDTDQRSQIKTFNIAPTYTRVISKNSVLNVNLYTRKDDYNYYPSPNLLADLGPIQTSSIQQHRTLMNAGGHADVTYVRGRHNVLAGVMYNSTFLREHDGLGIVGNTYNSPCVDAVSGDALPGYADDSQCDGVTSIANPDYQPVLAPYDLTRGGSSYRWFGHADIKELSMYVQDQIRLGQWNLNLGIRGDKYNGLAGASQVEPRVGVAYNVKQTGTVLRASYARTLETPFNENLVLSSTGCNDPVLAPLLACTPGVSGNLEPGFRNEFHAGLQQAFGKHVIFGGEYIWKYTHNAFDFSLLGNTPISFPIDWHNSKIPGYAMHMQVVDLHGFSGYVDSSSVAARFFPPQVAGAGATVGQSGSPFRIDHDEKYNQTVHVQYAFAPKGVLGGLWGGLNWRYDSGLVAGAVPCYGVTDPNSGCGETSITLPGGVEGIDLSGLTFDQQFEAGLICNGLAATPTSGFSACPAAQLTSKLVSIPAPGTENDDKNPPRIAPRSLIDVNLGKNNIFGGDRYKVDLDLTAINVTNKYALYNFLSTFSGTHYVTPRALTAKITLNF
jgi:hypothetical protein